VARQAANRAKGDRAPEDEPSALSAPRTSLLDLLLEHLTSWPPLNAGGEGVVRRGGASAVLPSP
jgi:hypothetical protein